MAFMASSASDTPMAASAEEISQAIVPPVVRKRGRPDGWDEANQAVYKFKVFTPNYVQWHADTIIRLHDDSTVTTDLRPTIHRGSWMFAENGDLRIKYHYRGDSSKAKDHVYRKIAKTECWELVDYGKAWYNMLLPVN